MHASTSALAPARRSGSVAGTGTLRLTRRGRIVVVMLALAAVFCLFALRSAPAASTDVPHHAATRTVVVAPGDTLWDIAERVDPGADPRSVVAEIQDLNALADDGQLRVGQPLYVPVD